MGYKNRGHQASWEAKYMFTDGCNRKTCVSSVWR